MVASRQSFRRRHWLGLVVIGLVVAGVAWLAGGHVWQQRQETQRQNALQPFYDEPADYTAAAPGQVLRSEPMAIAVPGGQAVRVLYRSEDGQGRATVSSGMVFVPSQPADGPRPVVAWAHGTVGLGSDCAPSRITDPTKNIPWVTEMLSRGWIVAATDYAGLGTSGPSTYLVGGDEARDVLNAVRAARNLEPGAGSRFAVWGHSQGGHASLFTAAQAAGYAPELQLVASAAAAPSAELVPLLSEQYAQPVSWVIGPDVAVSWPRQYPGLPIDGMITAAGRRNLDRLSTACVKQSALGAEVRGLVKQQFFASNPADNQAWRAAATAETPPALPADIPVLIVQSLSDTVVLPNTTAALIQRFCAAGSSLETLWIDNVSHMQEAIVTGPAVTDWLDARFAGAPFAESCRQPLPVVPASG